MKLAIRCVNTKVGRNIFSRIIGVLAIFSIPIPIPIYRSIGVGVGIDFPFLNTVHLEWFGKKIVTCFFRKNG